MKVKYVIIFFPIFKNPTLRTYKLKKSDFSLTPEKKSMDAWGTKDHSLINIDIRDPRVSEFVKGDHVTE